MNAVAATPGRLFTNYRAFGLNLRPSYIMPTHGFYNGWNPYDRALKAGGTLDCQFIFSQGEKRGIYQGIGAAVHTFFADELLGTPATLYVFQGAPLVEFSNRLSLGYEWNLGLSSGWKNNGIVTVSAFNVYINVAALLTWRPDSYWEFVFGPEYTHFSNGDTRFPNGGANTINLRIGAKRFISAMSEVETADVFRMENDKRTFAESISYDLTVLGGWRADRTVSSGDFYIINKPFPTVALNFNPLYRFNSHLSAGPSLDLLYDRSANLIVSEGEDGNIVYDYPSFLHQTSAGLSARFELMMPVFAVNIGIGYSFQIRNHTRYLSGELQALYGIFGLKTFLNDRLYLNVNYRLSTVLYSHNLSFGLGWRFGSIPRP